MAEKKWGEKRGLTDSDAIVAAYGDAQTGLGQTMKAKL
jgi:hypothetical protein